jgi:hypothetical protein
MKALGIIVALAAVAGAAIAAIKFAPVIKEKIAAKKAAKEAEDACCDCDDAAKEDIAE